MTDAQHPILNESTYDPDKEEWSHRSCGTILMSKTVHHPIHDGGIPLAGSGQVYNETVPYCPTCGPEPSSHGSPLSEHPADAQDREILRRISSRKT